MTRLNPRLAAEGRGTRWMALGIVLCMSAIYFFAFFQRVAIPGTIFNELQAAYTMSAGAVAGLGALYLYIYGGMQLVAGAMNDRFGAVRVLLIGGVLLSAGSLLFPLAGSPALLYGARALVALGSSLIFISVVKSLDQLFPPEFFPYLLGIALFIGYAGGLVGTFPFERAVHAWGWQRALFGIGAITALTTAGSAWVFRRTGKITRPANTFSLQALSLILRNRSSILLIIAMPISFGVYFLMQTVIGKKFLQDYAGMDSPTASLLTFMMMLMTMSIELANGFLLRLAGNRRKPLFILSIALTVLSMGLLLVCVQWQLSGNWFLAAYLLLGLSMLASPLSIIMMKEHNPPESIGLAVGVLNSACYLAVGLITTLAGAIMDQYHVYSRTVDRVNIYPTEAYAIIFLGCLLLLAAAFICSWFIGETREQGM